MDIRTTKLELLKTILETENKDFIQRVADFVKKEKVVVDTDDNDDAKVPQRNIADLVEESLKKNVDDIVEKDFNKRDIDDKVNDYKESKIPDVVGIEEEADSFHDINDEVVME